MDAPPVSGNRTIGSKAVAAMGSASESHQVATHMVQAKTAFASVLKPLKGSKKKTIKNKKGPVKSPIFFLVMG